MKKLLLLPLLCFLLISSSLEIKAQMIYIPDTMFRLKLTNLGYGTCITGDSIDASCPAVANALSLDVSNYGIYDLQGIQAFSSLNKLNCSQNYFNFLPALPNTLDTLLCARDSLDFLPVLPSGLLSLVTDSNRILNLPALPSTLLYLSCSVNMLTSLPTLPSNLAYLITNSNSLTSLPALVPSLVRLECNRNLISALPALPPALQYLDCYYNQLSSLPALPSTLTYLDCGVNQINSLPALPQLTKLICYINNLTSLPPLPSSLTQLKCNDNLIDSLPSLPNGLYDLTAGSNNLSSLPASLPPTLLFLDLRNNHIQNIPPLPNSLISFDCSNNQVSQLPSFPPNLIQILVDNNLLTTLPDLPPGPMTFLWCQNNANLACLPLLPSINNLNFSNCSISCLPNFPVNGQSTPPLASVPLCGVLNPNGCNFFWNISGRAYLDTNSDCSFSAGENGTRFIPVGLYENGNLLQQAFTGYEGFYSFDVNNYGNYEIRVDTLDIPFTSLCPNSNSYLDTINAADSLSYDNDFSLQCKSGFDLGVWSIFVNTLRPSHRSIMNIKAGDLAYLYGVHCASGISGSLSIIIIGNAHYFGPVAGALLPSNVTGNIITYNISDFGTVISDSDFVFEIETDTSATLGSQICFKVTISPSIDNNPLNNSLIQCFTVNASLDPNSKEVYPEGIIDTSQHYLTYTIHFQNTGTAPADNIYILDTLNSSIDVSSFQLLATSHPAYVQILEGGIARFNFANINLPDSNSNEPSSHGYVQYKARLKDNLSLGTQIHNTAYIYFDFNPPVVTNTTLNTIGILIGISENENSPVVNVWPVPFEDILIVQGNITGRFSIVNMLGVEVNRGLMNSSQMKINTENWTSGIYFLRMEAKNGVSVRKLIKK